MKKKSNRLRCYDYDGHIFYIDLAEPIVVDTIADEDKCIKRFNSQLTGTVITKIRFLYEERPVDNNTGTPSRVMRVPNPGAAERRRRNYKRK